MSNPTKHIKQQLTWTFLVLLMVVFGIGNQITTKLDINNNSTDYLLSFKKSMPADSGENQQPATPDNNSNTCENTVIDFEEEVDDTHCTVDHSSKQNISGTVTNSLTDFEEQNMLLFHPEATIPPPKA